MTNDSFTLRLDSFENINTFLMISISISSVAWRRGGNSDTHPEIEYALKMGCYNLWSKIQNFSFIKAIKLILTLKCNSQLKIVIFGYVVFWQNYTRPKKSFLLAKTRPCAEFFFGGGAVDRIWRNSGGCRSFDPKLHMSKFLIS